MELTVKEYAALERVTERTVRHWMRKGAVTFRRTPGGGVRIRPASSVARVFVFDMKKAEVCGNPST